MEYFPAPLEKLVEQFARLPGIGRKTAQRLAGVSYAVIQKALRNRDVRLNGKELGVQWYGRRLYDLSGALEPGENELEVRVTTTMGNYMKTLTDNKIAQKWTNRKSKEQPQQSMGLLGPVTVYRNRA